MKTEYTYTIEWYPALASMPQEDRQLFLQTCDDICRHIWYIDSHFWVRKETELFTSDCGYVLGKIEGNIVAFSLYQRLCIDGMKVLYRNGTNILPEHQGQGLYKIITEKILTTEQEQAGDAPLYLAVRTRNPIIWAANARWCKAVVPVPGPGEDNQELIALGRRVAHTLFPELPLETPSMILRGAYSWAYREPQHYSDPAIDAMFFQNTSMASDDAILVFGELYDAIV